MNRAERYAARDRAHLDDIIAGVRDELANPAPEPARHASHDRIPLPPVGSGFPRGARVYIDGDTMAKVREFYPNGSTSYGFAHYRLDVVGGDRNAAVAVGRVSAVKR